MAPLSGTLSAARLFSTRSRRRSRANINSTDNNNITSAPSTPLMPTRTTGSTESLPPLTTSSSFVPTGETMQRAAGSHQRQISRDSGNLSASSYLSMSASSSHSKGQSSARKNKSGFVLEADTGLTATTLINVEQQCALYDRPKNQSSTIIADIDKSEYASSFKMMTSHTLPMPLSAHRESLPSIELYDYSQKTKPIKTSLRINNRPAPIAIPAKSSTSSDAMDSAVFSANTAKESGFPAHLTYSPHFQHRRGSDSFLFDMPLRAGPSGYPWNSNTPQPEAAMMSRDPRRHGSERPYLSKSRVTIDTQPLGSASATNSAPLQQRHSVVAVAGRFATPAVPALLAAYDSTANPTDMCQNNDTLLPPTSPDILGTSPPGVHAWRRRRSLTPGPINTHISPSVSNTAPLSSQYPSSANKMHGNDSTNQIRPRLELWEARRELRAMGGLDELLAQPDATVKCTLTPVVCRDPYRISPLNLRVEEEEEEDEEENGDNDEGVEGEGIFFVDGEDALPMKPITSSTGLPWSHSWEHQHKNNSWTHGQQDGAISRSYSAIPRAIAMEKSATLPRAATSNSLLCEEDELSSFNALLQISLKPTNILTNNISINNNGL
ncbi:hypothetical protein BDF19DRAFT_419174 [Syncephalis fuscata]|nr:hypothetical protein BDF19DRAFT_419174 [Syncephalis fuscata]